MGHGTKIDEINESVKYHCNDVIILRGHVSLDDGLVSLDKIFSSWQDFFHLGKIFFIFARYFRLGKIFSSWQDFFSVLARFFFVLARFFVFARFFSSWDCFFGLGLISQNVGVYF
jgi:hypothetical protein